MSTDSQIGREVTTPRPTREGQGGGSATAVIMAAGLGTRFGNMTESRPKGFIEAGGVAMVERSVQTLLSCGIRRIVIGTGAHKEWYDELATRYEGIECVFSPRYAETNSMFTLYWLRQAIGADDFLLLESDLVFEQKAITSLLECPQPDVMLITPVTKFQDQYYVEADAQQVLSNCSTDPTALRYQGELVGIHKLSNCFYQQMCDDYAQKVDVQPKLGYEYQLLHMSQTGHPVHVLCVPGLLWYEIDDADDLAYAEEHVIGKINSNTQKLT